MKTDPDPTEPAAEPSRPPVTAKQPRRRRITALLNTTALVTTTALITAIDTKLPPYRGD
jgi:hypothetical protein